MANVNRINENDNRVVMIASPSSLVVEVGDIICRAVAADVADDDTLVLNEAVTPERMVDAGLAAANRAAVAAQMVGIALDASADGETEEIRIGYNGGFFLTQKTAAAIHIGDPVEVYADDTNAENQTVVEGATSPIGICTKTKTSTTETQIEVLIQPALMNV